MPVERMWRSHDLKPSYDVVIIGAGVHGLAIAYYLGRRHHQRRGCSTRATSAVGQRPQHRHQSAPTIARPEGVAFYDESVKLYENLALELDYNVMFSQQGHLNRRHTTRASPPCANGLRRTGCSASTAGSSRPGRSPSWSRLWM